MSFTVDEIVAKLGSMNMVELIKMTKELEQLWGVEAKPQFTEGVSPLPVEDIKPAQTEFDVVLVSYPADKKMALVKLVREVMSLGLLESKNFVEAAPKVLKEGISKDDAELLKAKLTEAGGVVEIK